MGLRFWIQTKHTPVFNYQIQWMGLNESHEGRWFFQDEMEDASSLHEAAGYRDRKNPPLRELYMEHPEELLNIMVGVTDLQLEQHMMNCFDRPTPYWGSYRLSTIYYMKVKQMYIKALIDAKIVNIVFDNKALSSKHSLWYRYREPPVPGGIVYTKRPGHIADPNE